MTHTILSRGTGLALYATGESLINLRIVSRVLSPVYSSEASLFARESVVVAVAIADSKEREIALAKIQSLMRSEAPQERGRQKRIPIQICTTLLWQKDHFVARPILQCVIYD